VAEREKIRKTFCELLENAIDKSIMAITEYAEKEYEEPMMMAMYDLYLLLSVREKLCKNNPILKEAVKRAFTKAGII